MGNADLVTATFCKIIFASLNPSQRLEGEFRNNFLTLNLLFESKCFILSLSNKIFWSFLCKYSLVRNCLPFYFENCAQNPAVTSYKGTKEIFCSNQDSFFSFTFGLKITSQKQHRKEAFLLVKQKFNYLKSSYSHFSIRFCPPRAVRVQHTPVHISSPTCCSSLDISTKSGVIKNVEKVQTKIHMARTLSELVMDLFHCSRLRMGS